MVPFKLDVGGMTEQAIRLVRPAESSASGAARMVPATFATRAILADPRFENEFAEHLRTTLSNELLRRELDRFDAGASELDLRMRRILWRALGGTLGDGTSIGRHVSVLHLERIRLGAGVHIGDAVQLHGRHDGYCEIGNRVWIGPQAFLDARDLVIEDLVGIGPGVRILGSTHSELPAHLPVIATELEIGPIRIGTGADIGTNAVILPGVSIGVNAIVGAGAVVTKSVPAGAVVAGVPARVIRRRKGQR